MFPLDRMECRQPGGSQQHRPGGSIHTPAVVCRIAKPDWSDKSCPLGCECSSVFQETGAAGRQNTTSSVERSTILCSLILSSAILKCFLATLAQFIAVPFAYDEPASRWAVGAVDRLFPSLVPG